MPDDNTRPAPPSYKRVQLNERWAVQYWKTAFGCSEAELRRAVALVGDGVSEVRTCLEAERQRESASVTTPIVNVS